MLEISRFITPLIMLVAIVYWFALRPIFRMRQQRRTEPVIRVGTSDADAFIVPVLSTATHRGGFLWRVRATSASRPSLLIAPEGLRYRVLAEGSWPYDEIEQVDVRMTFFGKGVRILFLGNDNHRLLSAVVSGPEVARQALAALPTTLPLSSEAAVMRDGTAAAATPGLRRYRGPVG
ncbi:hypothetical protein BH10PSE17_BH10PSE17_02830 [soil metagenome]